MRLHELDNHRVDRRSFLLGLAGLAAMPAAECRVVLTRSSPRGECEIAAGSPRLAEIPLQAVENPKRAPVNILVFGVTGDGSEVRIGALSLFPIDRPAVFVLRLHGATRITFDLLPGPLPLTAEVGPVRWLYQEPR